MVAAFWFVFLSFSCHSGSAGPIARRNGAVRSLNPSFNSACGSANAGAANHSNMATDIGGIRVNLRSLLPARRYRFRCDSETDLVRPMLQIEAINTLSGDTYGAWAGGAGRGIYIGREHFAGTPLLPNMPASIA